MLRKSGDKDVQMARERGIRLNITVTGLNKSYHTKKALTDIRLELSPGVYGLIGENGAGKTTLMQILSTVLPYDSGEILVDGSSIQDPKTGLSWRRSLGYLPQNLSLFQNITVFEILDYLAVLKTDYPARVRRQEIERVLELLNLTEQTQMKVNHLSGCMKQRVAIAQSLMFDPRVLLMDEPTVGLDPRERLRFRNVVNQVAKDKVILLSTHIIDDISVLCDHCIILKKGTVRYNGPVGGLVQRAERRIFTWDAPVDAPVEPRILEGLISISRGENHITYRFYGDEGADGGAGFRTVTPNLEDAYLWFMSGKQQS